MKNKYLGGLILGGLLMLSITPSSGAGVTGYTGNVESTNAGVASGSGNSASATVQMDVNVDDMLAIGVYDTSGANASGIFSTPSDDFTNANGLMTGSATNPAETDLNSKFALDGTTTIADMQTIVTAMQASSDASSDDLLIKGATFTNSSSTMTLTASANSLTLTGGTGTAPQFDFRLSVQDPGGSGTTGSTTPASGVSYSTAISPNGYIRYVLY